MNFATSSGDLYTETHERIHKISSGSSETLVFLCLGIESIRNIMGTGKLYIGLAQAHKRTKFFAFSVAGDNEDIIKNRYDIKNNQVLMFNKQLSHLINENKRDTPNLVFKDILKDPLNPLTFKNGQNVIKFLSDGINFNKDGAQIAFNLMTEGLL